VPEIISLVGLGDKIDKFPHELSGGQQQRVSIARAFVNRPPLLICDEPTAGRVLPAGQDVTLLPPWKRNAGMVFQSYALFPHMTVLANVAYGLDVGGVPRATARERAKAVMATVGLVDMDERLPSELSGGQQQRVGIARALVTEPALILADEPTGNLDSHSGAEVLSIFKDLHSLGRTIVLITHDIDVATAADRGVHIRDGQLYEAVLS